MIRWNYLLLPALCLVTACDVSDFSDEGEGESGLVAVVPTGHALGTQERPYAPDDLLRGGDLPYDEEVWVMGYVVGSTIENMENALFDVPTDYAHNILISNDPQCDNSAKCVAVELPTDEMQLRFSLAHRPDDLGNFIVIRGTLGVYYSQVGLRQADAAYWIDGFDLIRIAPPRQEWEILNVEF